MFKNKFLSFIAWLCIFWAVLYIVVTGIQTFSNYKEEKAKQEKEHIEQQKLLECDRQHEQKKYDDDYYIDLFIRQKSEELLQRVLAKPPSNSGGMFTHRVYNGNHVLYLSDIYVNNPKELSEKIQEMDENKTIAENFKAVAYVVKKHGEITYQVHGKDVSEKEFLDFFYKNLGHFSLLVDGSSIDSMEFLRLQKQNILLEKKPKIEEFPDPYYRYVAHYDEFYFGKLCCDVDFIADSASRKAEKNKYTLKDLSNIKTQDEIYDASANTHDKALINRLAKMKDKIALENSNGYLINSGFHKRNNSDPINLCNIQHGGM